MALILSAATGNFNAGATWVGGVVPTIGDEARASTGHTITINVNTTCDSISNVGSGNFILSPEITLTANVVNLSTTTGTTLNFNAVAPSSATVVGSITGGNAGTGNNGIMHSNTGTLNVTGNVTAGSAGSSAHGINVSAGGTLNVTGNVISSGSASTGITNEIAGNINITGIVTGATGFGVRNQTTGVITITGTVIGGTGSAGANNASTGTIRATRVRGNAYGPGNTSGLVAAVGAANVGLGIIEIEQLEYGAFGMSPTSGTGIRLKKANTNVAVFNYGDTAGAKTLIDATANAAMPAATDVRSGVSYASGALTGSAFIPSPATVATGVPVDNTVGTAALSANAVAAAVWGAATRTITGGTVDTLTNAPSVPSAASIRAEIDSNSTQLSAIKSKTDALPASPAATGDIPTAAQTATAVWSKPANDLTVADSIGERIKNCATTQSTGDQLAGLI
jgi:hypothetical protein